jgi:protein-S-isoprenylcysteine O-methyltransferase Ste14
MSILLLTPAGLAAVFSEPYLAANSWGDLSCEAVGWPLFILGATFRWWATLYIGDRKTYQFVNQGPYSICRNPLYFGTWLMGIAIAFLIQSLVFGLMLLVVSVFYLGITIPNEERLLAREYPNEFSQYRQRVPRFFPRFNLYQSPDVIEVRVAGLRAEFVRAMRWVWIPALCNLLSHLRTQDWWPHWSSLP